MRDQDVAADPWRRCVLLHAGVLGVEALDRAGMIAGDDGGNEFIETGARRHVASRIDSKLELERESCRCIFARRLANDSSRERRPSLTGEHTFYHRPSEFSSNWPYENGPSSIIPTPGNVEGLPLLRFCGRAFQHHAVLL